jgi:ribosomal protein S18 acetylase RimI-like enzyme
VFHRPRWRRIGETDLDEIVERLRTWPCEAGGEVRHMFPLATAESAGATAFRVAEDDDGWACAVLQPGQLIVPCGDPRIIAEAGMPQRRWRLLVGDAAAADAVLTDWGEDSSLIVHRQCFQSVEPERVPPEEDVADPGLRRAEPADVDGLADLAVQLHVDDGYGAHPGRTGWRNYRKRMVSSVRRGRIWVVGDIGKPVLKIERSVDSERVGVQLAGIVVQPERRGEGLGRAAVTTAVRHALADYPSRPISLHARVDNARALDVYRSSGFVDREEWRLAVRSG